MGVGSAGTDWRSSLNGMGRGCSFFPRLLPVFDFLRSLFAVFRRFLVFWPHMSLFFLCHLFHLSDCHPCFRGRHLSPPKAFTSLLGPLLHFWGAANPIQSCITINVMNLHVSFDSIFQDSLAVYNLASCFLRERPGFRAIPLSSPCKAR